MINGIIHYTDFIFLVLLLNKFYYQFSLLGFDQFRGFQEFLTILILHLNRIVSN